LLNPARRVFSATRERACRMTKKFFKKLAILFIKIDAKDKARLDEIVKRSNVSNRSEYVRQWLLAHIAEKEAQNG